MAYNVIGYGAFSGTPNFEECPRPDATRPWSRSFAGSVWVVDDERQRPRPLGHIRPAKRRRGVLALAAVAAGDRPGVLEYAALERERVHQQVKRSAAAVPLGSRAP